MLLASKKSAYFVTTDFELTDGIDCKGETIYIITMYHMGERNGLKGCIDSNEIRFHCEDVAYRTFAAMV